MDYQFSIAGLDFSVARSGRKQRVRREFCIVMRSMGSKISSASLGEAAAAPSRLRKWTKKIVGSKKEEKNTDSLMDSIVEFTKRKTMHWALVVKENPVKPGGKQFGPRMFEICGNPPAGSIPVGESYIGRLSVDVPEDMSDDELDDQYDADEDYPSANTLGSSMQMRVSTAVADTFEEPPYQEGGVFWNLLDRLRAETKFTNTEITNEAQRIWNRQQNYRMFNNNCHRFCILLAIHLRAKQESTLRILTGDILKVQATEGEFTGPVENPRPKKSR